MNDLSYQAVSVNQQRTITLAVSKPYKDKIHLVPLCGYEVVNSVISSILTQLQVDVDDSKPAVFFGAQGEKHNKKQLQINVYGGPHQLLWLLVCQKKQ